MKQKCWYFKVIKSMNFQTELRSLKKWAFLSLRQAMKYDIGKQKEKDTTLPLAPTEITKIKESLTTVLIKD